MRNLLSKKTQKKNKEKESERGGIPICLHLKPETQSPMDAD